MELIVDDANFLMTSSDFLSNYFLRIPKKYTPFRFLPCVSSAISKLVYGERLTSMYQLRLFIWMMFTSERQDYGFTISSRELALIGVIDCTCQRS